MRLIVKNMVCGRCIMTVEQILKEHALKARIVRLGEVELEEAPSEAELKALEDDLEKVGFGVLDDQKMQLIEKIKNLLIKKVQDGNIEDHFSISKFLSENIFKDYSSISKLFSEVQGITIEQFFLLQKIEKTKEYLMYNERSLNDIAFDLGYSSTQHLSTQFKKLTGMTPTQFKQRGAVHRLPIDQVRK